MSDTSRRPSVPEPLRRRALNAYRRLRALAIDLFRSKGGEPGGAEGIDLSVTLELGRLGTKEALERHGEAMLSEMAERIEDLAASLSGFRPGRAFCFFCRQSACPHAEPPGPQSAFAGYLPTGRPRWVDFPSLVLEWRDPRVEAVFASHPEVIALYRSGPALIGQLLPDFRLSPAAYDLVGEIVVGPLPVRDAIGVRHAAGAVTVQIVRCLGRDGVAELRLNVIGKVPGGGDVRGFLDEGGDDALARSLSVAERELASQNARLRASRRPSARAAEAADPAAEALLRRLARRVEQLYRQRGRRTFHAQVRTEQGVRPTRKALEDARSAPPERVLVDEMERTLVVLGPKGRVHVFSPSGRHVTSLSARREEVVSRIHRRRWRAASPPEVAAFKSAIAPSNGR